MKNYLIKLTPLAPFFFGSERTFGDGQNANYFAKSNPFPQQTTVLGMLRKELLIQGKILKEKWSDYTDDVKIKMKELIGESFKQDSENDFGKIKKLSPVFISKGSENYIQTPFDREISFSEEKGKSNLDKERGYIPYIDNYNSKDGLPDGFTSANGNKIKFDDVFKEFVKVGNAKDKNEDDNDKFFKQLFYTLEKNYSFAFFAEIDFNLKESTTVFMGADNSSFKMDVKVTDSSFEKLFKQNPAADKIILLSDALVDEEIYKSCEFAVTEIIDFKTIEMEYGRFKKRNNKHEMLKRGSVLFVNEKNRQKVEKYLNNKNLQKIGYNIYK